MWTGMRKILNNAVESQKMRRERRREREDSPEKYKSSVYIYLNQAYI